jgi:N-acetyl-anhydromuramyl-L-alanine amidase AmpD
MSLGQTCCFLTLLLSAALMGCVANEADENNGRVISVWPEPDRPAKQPRIPEVVKNTPQLNRIAAIRAKRYPSNSIVVVGQPFDIGQRVIKFNDPTGFDAYQKPWHFGQRIDRFGNAKPDLSAERVREIENMGYSLDALRQVVDRVVIHYDAAGSAALCFDVLNRRELSAHFLLDVDGTIYQTLDVHERAWHAGLNNSRSVGIEIAHLGARPVAELGGMDGIPPGMVRGSIHGQAFAQHPYTDAQYHSLANLLAGLSRALPKIKIKAPRDAQGRLLMTVMPPPMFETFQGLVGHYHLTKQKPDPGPAFDWSRVLTETASAGR